MVKHMELTESQRYGVIFGGVIILAGIVLSTVVFPFWNLIREDVFEEVEILASSDGICYANTSDTIPKTISNFRMASIYFFWAGPLGDIVPFFDVMQTVSRKISFKLTLSFSLRILTA